MMLPTHEQLDEHQAFLEEKVFQVHDKWPHFRRLATVLAKSGRIEAADLPAVIRTAPSLAQITRVPTMEEHERRILQDALEECGWNKKQTAKRLGISRSTLYDKLKKYQISEPTAH